MTSIADRDDATRDALRALVLDGRPTDVAGTTGVPGEAEGVLVGGNLTVLATSAGTPLTHGAADSIAVLEDVGEEPYRLDRSLTQLLRSGWFEGVRGVVLGQFTDCGRDPAVVRDLLVDRLGALGRAGARRRTDRARADEHRGAAGRACPDRRRRAQLPRLTASSPASSRVTLSRAGASQCARAYAVWNSVGLASRSRRIAARPAANRSSGTWAYSRRTVAT